ncbi:MAG: hypothetical protein QOD96_4281, partial [Pseudonocardiales bacterium]|nr:hypothetical protein [Pseudonocardiales bacterium]
LLGCPVTERAIELHAALAIYDTLPSST